MSAENGNGSIVFYLRIFCHELVHCVNKVFNTLTFVGYLLRYEKYDTLVEWQAGSHARLPFVVNGKHACVYWVGNIGNVLSYKQCASFCFALKPSAACHKLYVAVGEYTLFCCPHFRRQVIVESPSR